MSHPKGWLFSFVWLGNRGFSPQCLRLCRKARVTEEKTIDNCFLEDVTETRRNEANLRFARISTMLQEVFRLLRPKIRELARQAQGVSNFA